MRPEIKRKLDTVFNILQEKFRMKDVHFKVETCLNFINYYSAKGLVLSTEKDELIDYVETILLNHFDSDYYRRLESMMGLERSTCEIVKSLIAELRYDTDYDYEYYISPIIKYLN